MSKTLDDEGESKLKVVFFVEKSEKEFNIDINGFKRVFKMKRRLSIVDEMLFDDYVFLLEEVEEDQDKFDESDDVNLNLKRKILIFMGDFIFFDDDQEKELENRRKVFFNSEKFFFFISVLSIDSFEYSVGNNYNGIDLISESEYGGLSIKRFYSMGFENLWSLFFSIES